jgi:DNA-binding response OmpR family regulator
MAGGSGQLTGKRVLIVEDEALVTMLIEDALAELGCEVAGIASRFDDALGKAQSLSFDVAILDVNLDGQRSFPIAEALARRGIAFLFATGYGTVGLPPGISGAPVLEKPFQLQDLQEALRAALEPQYR